MNNKLLTQLKYLYVDKEAVDNCKKLAEKYPEHETTHYLCLGEHMTYLNHQDEINFDAWYIYEPSQKGYEWSKEKIPYYDEEELTRLLDEPATLMEKALSV